MIGTMAYNGILIGCATVTGDLVASPGTTLVDRSEHIITV